MKDINGKPVSETRVYGYEVLGGDPPEIQGISDYQSSITNSNGFFYVVISPGTYVFIARKRKEPEKIGGPITPDDYSSSPTFPIKINAEAKKINFTIYPLKYLNQGFALPSYFNFKRAVYGKVVNERGDPLPGLVVVGNRRKKIGKKPDFASFPTDSEGFFFLPLNGKSTFFVGVRRGIRGDFFPLVSGVNQVKLGFLGGGFYKHINLVIKE